MMSTKDGAEWPKRILLADDDDDLRMILEQIIVASGFEVTHAENGRIALDLYQQTPDIFDLLITDICMPELNGDDLIREIRNHNKMLPIIAITGFAQPELLQDIRSHGVALFEKPLHFKKLIAYINSL